MSIQIITHPLNKYYYDSEHFLQYCQDIQATPKDQSKGLLEDMLRNLGSIWNSLYESYRSVMLSRDSFTTPDLKRALRSNYDDNADLYYQAEARVLNLIKRLDNPVNLKFKSTSLLSQIYPTSLSRSCRDDQKSSSVPMKMIENSKCETGSSIPEEVTEKKLHTNSQDLSNGTLESARKKNEDYSASEHQDLSNPKEIKPTQASTTSVVSIVAKEKTLTEVIDPNPSSGLYPVAAYDAILNSGGGRDLPQRVENDEGNISPIVFGPNENKYPFRPSSTPPDEPINVACRASKNESAIKVIITHESECFPRISPTQSQNYRIIESRVDDLSIEFIAIYDRYQLCIEIYHHFTLRWLDYLKFNHKRRKWKST